MNGRTMSNQIVAIKEQNHLQYFYLERWMRRISKEQRIYRWVAIAGIALSVAALVFNVAMR